MKKPLSSLFLKEKPVMTLVFIGDQDGETYCSEVSAEIDSTYAHTVRIISRLKELGLLETEKKGRKKMLKLTPEGKSHAQNMVDVLEGFNNTRKKGSSIEDQQPFE